MEVSFVREIFKLTCNLQLRSGNFQHLRVIEYVLIANDSAVFPNTAMLAAMIVSLPASLHNSLIIKFCANLRKL
jgi:hypothetical protein